MDKLLEKFTKQILKQYGNFESKDSCDSIYCPYCKTHYQRRDRSKHTTTKKHIKSEINFKNSILELL